METVMWIWAAFFGGWVVWGFQMVCNILERNRTLARHDSERDAADLHIRLNHDRRAAEDNHADAMVYHRETNLTVHDIKNLLTPEPPFYSPVGYHCGGS